MVAMSSISRGELPAMLPTNYTPSYTDDKCWADRDYWTPAPAGGLSPNPRCPKLPVTDAGLCEEHYEEIIGEVGRANRHGSEAFDGTLGPVLRTVEPWSGEAFITPEYTGDAA